MDAIAALVNFLLGFITGRINTVNERKIEREVTLCVALTVMGFVFWAKWNGW